MARPLALAAISLALLAAGCGGDDDGPTKSDVVTRSDAICERAARETERYAEGHERPSNPTQVEAAIRADVRISEKATRDLERIELADEDRSDFERFLRAERGIVAANRAQAAAATGDDDKAFLDSANDALEQTRRAKRAAEDYGLEECPYRPVSAVFAGGPDEGEAGGEGRGTEEGDLAGVWAGRVTQYGPGDQTSRYPAVMDIGTGAAPGDKAGRITYPSFPCSGELQLSRSEGNRYVLRERITSGRDRCTDGGTIISVVSGDRQSWRWFSKGIEVLGTLRREGSGRETGGARG